MEFTYDLPADFKVEQFNGKLIQTFSTIADFVEAQEWAHWRYDFMLNVLKSLASSDFFVTLSPNERVDMMACWENIRYVIEVLRGFFTEEVTDNSIALTEYLKKHLPTPESNLPEKP